MFLVLQSSQSQPIVSVDFYFDLNINLIVITYFKMTDLLFDFLAKSDRVLVETEMSNLVVEESTEVTIVCTASGQPNPIFNWKKNGGKPSSDARIKEGKFTLLDVQLWDEGTYSCEATNIISTNASDIEVTVVPKVEFKFTPPAQIYAEDGSRVQLDCQGTRFSNVTWQREGGNLPTGHLLHPNGTLVLLNASTDDASGVYMCKVTTIFRSINTTTRVRVTYRSCSHLKKIFPFKTSGNYYIDLDGDGGGKPFLVYCDMVDKGGSGVTVISHDKENRERVKGCDSAGCFTRDVTYTDVTLTQLASLTRVSYHCEQFIMFECKNSVRFVEEKYAWWASRDSTPMYYWGGAVSYSSRCACGMTNTCEEGGGCNCKNSGHGGWRNDSGLLTDKLILPVTQLRFGDVEDDDEEGYYTLGKFKCYGTIAITGIYHKNNA